MSDKQKKKEAMNNLLSGLTMPGQSAAAEEQSQASVAPAKGRRGRPPRGDQWETAYLVVNKERYGKIRVIAEQSGRPIKDIADSAFADYIRKVEKINGVIRIPKKTIELPPSEE